MLLQLFRSSHFYKLYRSIYIALTSIYRFPERCLDRPSGHCQVDGAPFSRIPPRSGAEQDRPFDLMPLRQLDDLLTV